MLAKGRDMKAQIRKPTMEEQLQALAALPDDQIDYSDAPPLTDEQWANAVRGKFYRPLKESVTVRVDSDVVAWLKSQSPDGKGYQRRMNAILRHAMLSSLERKT